MICGVIIIPANIIWRRHISKAHNIHRVGHTKRFYTKIFLKRINSLIVKYRRISRIFSLMWNKNFSSLSLVNCSNPRIYHFLENKVITSKKPKKEISRYKIKKRIYANVKKEVRYGSYTTYEKSSMSEPHKDFRMLVQHLWGHPHCIQPNRRSHIRFFDFLVRKKPYIAENTYCQMSDNSREDIPHIKNRKAHQETQQYSLVSIKKGSLMLVNSRKNVSHCFGFL